MKITVRIQDETYIVEVGDLTARPILATVEGETFEVFPEELQMAETVVAAAAPRPAQKGTASAQAQAPDCAPPASSSRSAGKTVAAPIPGVIISIAAKVGDQVEHGQQLCVLEAMKMKNTIRASRSGKIAAIHISNGDTVSHGQPLMDFTD